MALQLASRHPKQIHGLIILGCRTYPQTEVQRASTKVMAPFTTHSPLLFRAPGWAFPFAVPLIAAKILPLFWHPMTFRWKPWLPARFWVESSLNHPWVMRASFNGPPLPAKSLKEYVDLFKSIRQPALLIDGEEDVPGATGVQRMAADLADVRTFNVSGSRHFPHMERPETVNTLIQHWLQSKVMIAA
ncbi:hypothetical protein WJX84_011008 [Apatococcus fuscideae]|uniref:Uncharacterized protein n=1 Tax=Apatococcus fuscideae TaxID=2026836 RepID=A0AAW1SJ07_9CHLO